jgi:hypothetical protein
VRTFAAPVDACELAEMLSFIAEWLARDPRLAESLADFVGHPAYAFLSSARTWAGSRSCSAAATASNGGARMSSSGTRATSEFRYLDGRVPAAGGPYPWQGRVAASGQAGVVFSQPP